MSITRLIKAFRKAAEEKDLKRLKELATPENILAILDGWKRDLNGIHDWVVKHPSGLPSTITITARDEDSGEHWIEDLGAKK